MNWHNRYKAMKKGLGLYNSDISKITGNTTKSIDTVTQPNASFPRWCKFAVYIYETMLKRDNDVSTFCSYLLEQCNTPEKLIEAIREKYDKVK